MILMTLPTEDQESYELARRLNINNYKFSHIWNESGQRWTRNIIIMMQKKKKMWVSPWFPDYCIILKNWSLLFIELKRQKPILKNGTLWKSPSKVSEEQIDRVLKLNQLDNVFAYIAYWANEAIQIINDLEQWI